jgi:hypothetical protein
MRQNGPDRRLHRSLHDEDVDDMGALPPSRGQQQVNIAQVEAFSVDRDAEDALRRPRIDWLKDGIVIAAARRGIRVWRRVDLDRNRRGHKADDFVAGCTAPSRFLKCDYAKYRVAPGQ